MCACEEKNLSCEVNPNCKLEEISKLLVAIADEELNIVYKAINDRKVTPNNSDENGYSLMHAAVSYNQLELLKFFIENGGNVDITDNDGDTLLHYTETPEMADYLLGFGCSLESKNKEDKTPIDTTIEDENEELLNHYISKWNIKGEFKKDSTEDDIFLD